MIRTKRLQSRITAGRFTLPAAIFLSVICWMLTAVLLPRIPAVEDAYALWGNADGQSLSLWASYLLSFFGYCIIGYLLIALNNTYAIIRMRASVQTAIYILLISVCPAMHQVHTGDFASVAFLLSLFFLFRSYQQQQAAGSLFFSFAFIGAGSLLFPQLTLFVPVFWIGASAFQALKLKSFFGSLVGYSLPYWFLLGHAYFHDRMSLFCAPFAELVRFRPILLKDYPLWEVATLTYLFVLFAVSSVHCLLSAYEDKIRTRSFLRFLIFLTLCIFLFIVLQPVHTVQLLPLLLIGISILTGHFAVLTNSRASNVFFISALAGLLLLFGFNVWTLL